MEIISKSDLAGLFGQLREVFAAKRDFLIELDGKVGDSDLGLTMNKAFIAAHDSVSANVADPVGRTIQLAGMAIAKAAPSTMGTLVATGFMRGGKALEAASSIGTAQMALFWNAFLTGVIERGKAKRGDKTLIDVVAPIAEALDASAATQATLALALSNATAAATAGLEATKGMIAQHGKAACFQEKTLGLQDAGATVGLLIIDAMRAFVVGEKAQS
ncbi:MAG: Dak phosphatase [Proteobacteria bacterium]|nr:Dak phosphatase [Pseudomonadota bacterium]